VVRPQRAVLPVGKLPAEVLARLLAAHPPADPRIIVGPRVGEDAAVLDMGDRYLVAKSDPITFAADEIGWYAVHVNANDVACAGGAPRWFLMTLLLPEGSATADAAEAVFDQVRGACRELGAELVGGHTEITAGLDRPILVGCMLGEVGKAGLVQTAGARPGDALLLTKGIAIEGMAVLARECPEVLRAAGVDPAVLARARAFLRRPGISVVPEARLAAASGGLHALHDPTEGGLATGLHEVAEAAGVGLRVDAGAVPVLPECAAICRALGLDPLGTLASGALLIAAPPADADRIAAALAAAGIPCARIGEVLPAGAGRTLVVDGRARPLPTFARDELARVFEAPASDRPAG
jgi:hydrogenase expression/formation protein HypE